jgi:hypothetical protein
MAELNIIGQSPKTTCLQMKKTKPNTKEHKKDDRQVNQYDKILRENIEVALPGLIRNLLNIHAIHTEELPDDIQHTKERKPDVLKKVTDKTGETFVLHIEFQVKDEPKMVFRMAEYYIMLLRRYEVMVRQYVIYIGAGNPTMTDHIHSEPMDFKYQLIAFSAIDYHLLLRSDKPEEKMLAILADLGEGDPKRIIENLKICLAPTLGPLLLSVYRGAIAMTAPSPLAGPTTSTAPLPSTKPAALRDGSFPDSPHHWSPLTIYVSHRPYCLQP